MLKLKKVRKKEFKLLKVLLFGRSGNGVDSTFTIRKIGANSVGVERIFPLYSESLKSFEVIRKGRVRRAKLKLLKRIKR